MKRGLVAVRAQTWRAYRALTGDPFHFDNVHFKIAESLHRNGLAIAIAVHNG